MVKGRFKRKRSYRRFPKFVRRRLKDKRIALLPTIAALVPAMRTYSAYGSPERFVQVATQNPIDILKVGMYQYTGFDVDSGSWDISKAIGNAIMVGVATGGHIAANKLGVNRQIGKIPFVGKYIAL